MTEIFGTVASDTALIILAPWRMMPRRSTSVPIMKPGTSASNRRGVSKESHSEMKRQALPEQSLKRSSPVRIGLGDTRILACALSAVHARASKLLEAHLLADHDFHHARRTQIHRCVALDHDDNVAKGGDVRAARRRRAEEKADLRYLA